MRGKQCDIVKNKVSQQSQGDKQIKHERGIYFICTKCIGGGQLTVPRRQTDQALMWNLLLG